MMYGIGQSQQPVRVVKVVRLNRTRARSANIGSSLLVPGPCSRRRLDASAMPSSAFVGAPALPLRAAPCALLSRRALVAPVLRRCAPVRMAAMDKKAKAKEFAQLYGFSYVGTSVTMSAVSFAVWYALVAAGVDVRAVISALGDWLATTPVGRPSVLADISDSVGTATLAYIAHKASSPLRFPLTIAATPVVARAFSRRKGGDDAKG